MMDTIAGLVEEFGYELGGKMDGGRCPSSENFIQRISLKSIYFFDNFFKLRK